MNTCIKCGCQDAYPSLPPCPVPATCPNPQPCSEVFDAQCIVYTLPNILCGTDIVVTQDDTVAEALASIVAYFCGEISILTTAIANINIALGDTVQSVTGLNTDNTDPQNPIVKISVDGTTITGLGTPASPLIAIGGGGSGGSNFYLYGTTTDAGSNKIGDIERPAAIYIGADSYFNNVKIGTGLGNISSNTAIGKEALNANTTGYYNTAIGNGALKSNTTGYTNTAIGKDALTYHTTGDRNTAIGDQCLLLTTTGRANTAIGMYAAAYNTTGSSNIAIGLQSLYGNTTGDYNIAIGVNCLIDDTTGFSNIAIGYNTSCNNFNNSIIIGNAATATGNNQFVVGSTTKNAGSIVTGSVTQTKYWNVIINGVAVKILLAD